MTFIAAKRNAITEDGPDKNALLIVTLLTGFFGGHTFYLGKRNQGILYLVFFWTLIPSIISVIDFVRYVMTPSEEILYEYKKSTISLVVSSVIMITLLATMSAFVYFQKKSADAVIKMPPPEWQPTSDFVGRYEAAEINYLTANDTAARMVDLGLDTPQMPPGFIFTEPSNGCLEFRANGQIPIFTDGMMIGTKLDGKSNFTHYCMNIPKPLIDSCLPDFIK